MTLSCDNRSQGSGEHAQQETTSLCHEVSMKITYWPGSSNGNADALSRKECPELKEYNHMDDTIGSAPGRRSG